MKPIKRLRPWVGALLASTLVLGAAIPGFANESTPPSGTTEPSVSNNTAAPADSNNAAGAETGSAAGSVLGIAKDPYYLDKIEEWKKQGASAEHTGSIQLNAAQYTAKSEENYSTIGSYGQAQNSRNNVLVWPSDGNEWVEYELEVQQGGLYSIDLAYHPMLELNHRRPVSLNISIDGSNHFSESRAIQLSRQWKDELPARKDVNDDEVRPMAEEITSWSVASLRDMAGAYAEPLQWYLTPGKHTLRITTSDPVAIDTIVFRAPDKLQDYQAVRSAGPEKTALQTEGLIIQAEATSWKSDSSIPLAYDNDVASSPFEIGKIRYNTIDGNRWSTGNQELNYVIDVPESGYYKIALRGQQSFYSNRSVFRQILVNGKVPFSELSTYRFEYNNGWRSYVLEDQSNKPFEFYLEKGQNTLTFRVTQAPLKPIIVDMEKVIEELKALSAELKALTGGVEDRNRTWKIQRDLPGFVEKLRGVAGKIEDVRKRAEVVNGRSDAVTQGLATVIQDINSLLKYEDEIPYEEARLVSLQGNVGDFMGQLQQQPLQVDSIYIVPADKAFPKMTATFWEKFRGGIINFFVSFQKKDDITATGDDVLNVWVMRGRDYVNLLQDLVEESFTPQTGIKAKINLLPGEELLVLFNAAGISPDVALGLNEGLPFDYALRNGLQDLREYDDFDEVYNRYAPGSWVPFYYDDGYYGMPETSSFQVMYYRKDILEQLGLEVPDTWEDVYKMLPVLQQNNMGFTRVDHNVWFMQNGADYIAEGGYKTALSSEKGFDAFKQWTEFYTKYGVDPRVESFYQRFRDGSIPIGIGDYSMYIQLTVAAPELNGWWGVAPIPGMKQEDGTVARWMGGGLSADVIFKRAKMKDEAWEFLKWWSSAEIQERYGKDLETLNGPTFRWNTANVEAFVQLPWNDDDLNAILEQWRWYKEIPNVPGSTYFLGRELENAWNRTYVDGINYRSSLEEAIRDIDREIARKAQEFNILDKEGNVIRELPLPDVSVPWNGVDEYVKK